MRESKKNTLKNGDFTLSALALGLEDSEEFYRNYSYRIKFDKAADLEEKIREILTQKRRSNNMYHLNLEAKEELNRIRKRAGLTYRELGKKLGLSYDVMEYQFTRAKYFDISLYKSIKNFFKKEGYLTYVDEEEAATMLNYGILDMSADVGNSLSAITREIMKYVRDGVIDEREKKKLKEEFLPQLESFRKNFNYHIDELIRIAENGMVEDEN